MKISTIKGRKHCEKRRNRLLQAISLFLTMFSTAIISLVRQNAVLCGNGLKGDSLISETLLLLSANGLSMDRCMVFVKC